MKKTIDISGKVYSNLIVLHIHGKDSTGKITWLCRCSCGNETVVSGLNLKSGNTKSCGCLKKRPQSHDLTGRKFSKLTVLQKINGYKGKAYWLCQCDCGSTATVWAARLLNGHTRSCGCYKKEITGEVNRKRLLGKRGKETPRWLEELSSEERDRKRDIRHKEWSAYVLKKDGYSCVVCKKKGKLHAHHFNGYRKNPSQRYDPYNGVCLCKDCHIALHKAKGYGKITREDFYTFFNLPNPDEGVENWKDMPFPTKINLIEAIYCLLQPKENTLENLIKAEEYLLKEISELQNES